jgi:hypothetical protein
MPATLNLYRLKIWLVGAHAQPMSKLHRIIDISGNATFTDLHVLIFDAFDREDDHLYRFLLTHKEKMKKGESIFACKESVEREIMVASSRLNEEEPAANDLIEHLADEYTLDDAQLKEKDTIYYWFDFGDDWIHRIRVEKIRLVASPNPEDSEVWIGYIDKKVGTSPPQYDENSVWDEDGGATRSLKMFALLMELASPNATPVMWEEIEEAGLAKVLLQQKLIEPRNAIDPTVHLTAEGRASGEMLLQMQEMAKSGMTPNE